MSRGDSLDNLVIGQGVVDWVADKLGAHFSNAQGIGCANGEIVAGVVYENWNGRNVVCHIASDLSKRWMTRKYLQTIFDYPFNQMKADRITAPVAASNRDSRRFLEHLGFELEATLEDADPTGDLLLYRLFRNDCKWV